MAKNLVHFLILFAVADAKHEQDLASAEILEVIEEIPYHELFIHDFVEYMPRGD